MHCVGEVAGKGHSYIAMGRQDGQSHCDPAIPIIEINPEDESQKHKNTYILFIAELLIIAKYCKYLNIRDGWMNCGTSTQWSLNAKNKNEDCFYWLIWQDF